MTYAQQAEGEMWDTIAGVEPQDTRSRLMYRENSVNGHTVTVSRIVGTRTYVASVDGRELPGYHDWTIDALNAGIAAAA